MRLRLSAALFALVSVLALTTLRTSAQDPASAPWANDLAPIAPTDWSYARAAHLIERAGFGAPPEEVARLAQVDARNRRSMSWWTTSRFARTCRRSTSR